MNLKTLAYQIRAELSKVFNGKRPKTTPDQAAAMTPARIAAERRAKAAAEEVA